MARLFIQLRLAMVLAVTLLGCFDNPAAVDRVVLGHSFAWEPHWGARTRICPAKSCQHADSYRSVAGRCTYSAVADGTPCDDGNACTQTDVCQSGVCTGTNPILCPTPPNQCHPTDTCDPMTGTCPNPIPTDGTPCDDANDCTTGDVWVKGACEGLVPCSGEMLTRAQQTVTPSLYLRYIWGSGANDIYVTGYYAKYLHITGQGPFPTRMVCNAGSHLGKIWGSSATDVYTVSLNKVLHSVGSDIWETQDTDDTSEPGILHSIWGSSSTDIYAVDYYAGKIFHSAGDKRWALDPSPTEGLIIEALRGSGANDVYAVGYDPHHSSSGFIIHRGPDGVWTLVADRTSVPALSLHPLQNVWANSPSDVYVVGNDGLILHSTGDGTWTVQESDSASNVTSIWAAPGGTPVFVTTGPRILKSEGARPDGTGTWTPLPSGAPFPINDIWGDSATSLWVVSLSATEEIHLTHVTLDGNVCDGWPDGDPCTASSCDPTRGITQTPLTAGLCQPPAP